MATPPRLQDRPQLRRSSQEAIDALRLKLKEESPIESELLDDFDLLRFLVARDFDQTKALALLVADISWRSEYNVELLCDRPAKEALGTEPDNIASFFPVCHHGFDLDGRPIIIKKLGALDLSSMLSVVTFENYLRFYVRMLPYFAVIFSKSHSFMFR